MSRFKAAGVDGVRKGQSHPLRRSEAKWKVRIFLDHIWLLFLLSQWLILKAKRKRMRKNLDVIQESVGCLVFCNFHNLKLLEGGVMICNRRKAEEPRKVRGALAVEVKSFPFWRSRRLFLHPRPTQTFSQKYSLRYFVFLCFVRLSTTTK